MTTNVATAHLLLSLFLIYWLLSGPIRKLLRDNLRTSLRNIRDDLFDFMWKNGLSYDQPEYRQTRELLNAMIRGSNVFSFGGLFLSIVFRPTPEESQNLSTIIANMPEGALKQKLTKVVHDSLYAALGYIFFQTPGGLIFTLFCCCVRGLRAGWMGWQKLLGYQLTRFESHGKFLVDTAWRDNRPQSKQLVAH